MMIEAITKEAETPISFLEEGSLDNHERRALAWYRRNKRVEPSREQVHAMSGYWRMIEKIQKFRCPAERDLHTNRSY